MRLLFSKKAITTILVLVVLGLVFLLFTSLYSGYVSKQPPEKIIELKIPNSKHEIIGLSVEGRNIEAYTFGNGENHLLFVGGIHGGYEWNSVLLSYRFIDYLKADPEIIPSNISITIIPTANPDGIFKVIGKEGSFLITDIPKDESLASVGRFNANKVDLNRNFDCKWKSESTWKGNIVSAGSSAFSEPETKAIENFVLKDKPKSVIFWHSQSNAVYASECKSGILPETLNIMNTYAKAAGYPAVKTFDSYEITGDAEGWLASINIPAITVELKTHETIEWDKNLAGFKALLDYYKLYN